MTTTDKNKLLAEFLGHDKKGDDVTWTFPSYLNGKLWVDEHFFNGTDDYCGRRETKISELKFHKDWNWIMQVVEKIENLGCNEIMGKKLYSRFEINHNNIKLHWSKDNKYQLTIETLLDWKNNSSKGISKEYIRISVNENTTKLEAIYLLCVNFVKWYNKQNNIGA